MVPAWTETCRSSFYIFNVFLITYSIYKVVQIWPGLFTLVYTQISPGHIWTTLYNWVHSLDNKVTHILNARYSNQFCRQIFRKMLKHHNPYKSVQWQPSCSMRMDRHMHGQTNMTKPTVAFRNSAEAPEKSWQLTACWSSSRNVVLATSHSHSLE